MGGGALAVGAMAAGCSNPNEVKAEGFTLGEVPTDQMTYRESNKGAKVSILGYGFMRLPNVNGAPYGKDDAELDQEQINALVDYAIAHGVNLFDTSPRYCKGHSEHSLGIALSRHDRSEYMVSTKLSNQSAAIWSKEGSVKMFEDSLKELQVDYIDFYMLHCVGLPGKDLDGNDVQPMDALNRRFFDNGMMDYLVEQREKGRIRHLGFSYHGDVAVFDHLLSLHDKYHWDHVLIESNYVDWHHATTDANAEYLYGELAKRDIPVFVMEPLLGGRLAEMPEFAVKEMKSREPQQSVASWAFRFAASMPRILTVLSGMTYMEHLQDNIRTYAPLKPLTEEEQQMLLNIADTYSKFSLVPCTNCQYCMPCPYGLDIPGIFRHYNKCVNDGNVVVLDGEETPDRKAFRKARKTFLVGYDRSVPKLRQADHCIGCGRCVAECPQSIKIPEEMVRINAYADELKRSLME